MIACIAANERIPSNDIYHGLPQRLAFMFAYLFFLISIVHLFFGKQAHRNFHGGVSVIMLGHFLLNAFGLERLCSIRGRWWHNIFRTDEYDNALASASIATVAMWMVIAVLVGLYIQRVGTTTLER